MFQNVVSGMSSRLLELCRAHLFVILLALLVGTIYAAPDVYHAHTNGYQGVVMASGPDEELYLTIINKSYGSPGLVADPFQYEYRQAPNPLQYFFVEFGLGRIGAALHLPIDGLLQAMDFFFPALLVLVLYAFVYSVSGSRLAGVLASGAILLGNEIVLPGNISNIVNTFLMHGGFTEFLTYSRPISPQEHSIFFFIMIGCLLYLLRNPRSKWAILLSGVGVGLMAYIYLYFWAFLCALLGVMFLYGLITRNWTLTLGVAISGVFSLACTASFFIANLPVLIHATNSALTLPTHSHKIILEKMILVPLFFYSLIFIWAWWSRGEGKCGVWASAFAKRNLFVLLLLITGVIVSDQQVLTGTLLFQEHFHFYTNIPIFLLSMSLLGMELLVWVPMLWRIIAISSVLMLLVWFTIGVQISSYKSHSNEFARYQELAPIFSYLRTQAPAQSVVLSDWQLSTKLTIYTQDFSYATTYDMTFEVPWERLVHDYFVTLALRGVTASGVRDYMYQTDNRVEIGSVLFIGTYWRNLCGTYSCFPDSVLEELIPQYREFISLPLKTNIRSYKIDYILWDKVTDPGWKINEITVGNPLIESGDFALYQVRQ